MIGNWHGGKGSTRRPGIDIGSKAAKALGCGWCEYYFAMRKKCNKPKNIKCPKEE
jgi:hypothetical protein